MVRDVAGAAFVASFTLDGPVLLVVLLAGFVLAGWGIATVIPGAMVGADSVLITTDAVKKIEEWLA